VTATGYAREGPASAKPGAGGTGIPSGRSPVEGLADQIEHRSHELVTQAPRRGAAR